jgi:hypothetical protein
MNIKTLLTKKAAAANGIPFTYGGKTYKIVEVSRSKRRVN